MEKLRYERPIIKRLESDLPNKFGMKVDTKPLTHIDGVSVRSLIENYGSPLYVISENTIRSTFQKAKKAFSLRYPKVQFAWSYKTNYLDAVCNLYHQMGSWAEVVSGFEYDKAIKNGVNPQKIIFNGPDKTNDDLSKAILNDSLIHIDHLDEFYTIIELADQYNKRPRVAIRVNMDTGIFPMWDRFGFNYENGQAWEALVKIMNSGKVDLVGLHCHIGTFVLSTKAFAIAATKLCKLAIGLKHKFNHRIKYIDLGGGFASKNTLKGAYLSGYDTCPTFDDYAEEIVSAIYLSDFSPDELPLLILETGRALIDDAGYLLGTVISNKRSATGKRTTIVDIGINLLFTSLWYDHKISPAQEFSQYQEETTVYGPLCMNIDVVRENTSLPLLNKGDHIVIHHVGAYNMTQWMQFITLRPNVVMIDTQQKVHIIRHKETMELFSQLEQIPDHLKNFEL